MKNSTPWLYALASALGIFIFYSDAVITATNDDGSKFTLMFLVASGFIMGCLQPARAWRWALAVGLWMPLLYIAAKAFHFVPIGSSTYGKLLLFVPIGIIPALIGSYAGALLRTLILPPTKQTS
jgi:hypothetical protein